jgi:CheY-like chemotaxis protein
MTHQAPTQPSNHKIVNIARKYPLRVMLAEDNLINQKMMVMMMRRLGYEILIASNGAEVLQQLERESIKGRDHEIQCILMDASMDVMDGLECTRVIRAQQFPNRVRPFIIAQTANVTDEYRQKCLDSGMVSRRTHHPQACLHRGVSDLMMAGSYSCRLFSLYCVSALVQDQFICKPIHVESLIRCLRTAYATHLAEDAEVTPIPAAVEMKLE